MALAKKYEAVQFEDPKQLAEKLQNLYLSGWRFVAICQMCNTKADTAGYALVEKTVPA